MAARTRTSHRMPSDSRFQRIRRFGFGRWQLRKDLDDEIRFHLETTTRKLIDAGMDPRAADTEARRRFGDLNQHRNACRKIDRRRYRTSRREELMNDLLLDLKFAWRSFRRSPGFVVVAVLTLAIGMAANAVVYSMVYGLLLKPLPYGEPDELMSVWDSVPARGIAMNTVSAPNYADWRRMSTAFEDLAAQVPQDLSLTGLDRPWRMQGYRVTANLFDVLAVAPMLGRTFVPGDDEPGAAAVVVLSHSVWERRFGADASLVGRSIVLDDLEHTVIGVMPPRFEYPQFQFRGDLFVPIQFTPEQLTEPRSSRYLAVVGRLNDGATEAQAQAEMTGITELLDQEYRWANADRRANVIALQDLVAGPMRPAILIMLATVAFVLLICCANIANLFLARGSVRQAEIAVRSALGASRPRLIRQMLTEGVAIAVVGGLLGFVFSRLLLGVIGASLPDAVQRLMPSTVGPGADWQVFFATMTVASMTGLVFAILPALRASRVQLQETLKGSVARVAGPGGRSRMRSLLVVGEVAVSVVLVVGAGLMIKGFIGMMRTNPGFEPVGALTFPLNLPESRYETGDDLRGFYGDVLERVRTLPGVESVAAASLLPLTFSDSSGSILLEGRPEPEPGLAPLAGVRRVTAGYLKAMGIPVVRGRGISELDDVDAPRAVLVNEAFTRQHFPQEDPLGRRLRFTGSETWWEIVGVVGDVHHDNLDYWATKPIMYFPFRQRPFRRMTLVVRTTGETGALAGPVTTQIWAVDPNLPIGVIQSLEEIVDTEFFLFRLPAQLMAAFGLLALVLAAVGLYGVMSYLVAQRTREIGIRMALGAGKRPVVRLVVGHGLLLATVGVVLGTVAAFGVGQLLAAVLPNVSGREVSVFVGVPLLLLAVTLLASWIPARRAARVDPLVALRAE